MRTRPNGRVLPRRPRPRDRRSLGWHRCLLELPNLSIFFSAADEYAGYLALSGQEGSKDPVPGASIISYAFATRAEVDDVIDRAVAAGGSAEPAEDVDGSYIGYFADQDGYIWELVANEHTAQAAATD